MRQTDHAFLSAISELRLGKCSMETQEYLSCLSRPLPMMFEQHGTHIFFRKVNAVLFNRLKIDNLPGEFASFSAVFENDVSNNINWPGYRVLQLKKGCRVMLISNKSDQLRNGSIGVFEKVTNEALLVSFEGVGVVEVKRETWVKRDHAGVAVGSVRQFPLIPAYAVTCHKSQGLTLPAAVIHCSNEYVPGLIYVAVSRVKSIDCVQLLNFNANQLLPPSNVIQLCSTNNIKEPCTDLTCCSQQECLDEKCFAVTDRFSEHDDANDDQLYFPINMFDGLVSSCFEESDNPDKQVPVELIEIYEHLDDVNSNNALPSPECVRKLKEFLVHEKQDQPLSSFFLEQNAAIEGLLKEENDTKLNALISIIWNHVFKLIGDHVVQNADDIVFNLGRQHFTDAVAGLHEFFIGTDFSSYVNAIFVCEQPSIAQRTVIIQLSKHIFEEFLKHLLKIVQQNQERSEVAFKVDDMSGVGRSKVRYVGGWAIFKILANYKRYIKVNMFSLNPATLSTVCMKQECCDLLEQNILIPFARLEHNSQYPETLQVTEGRQYRERGLLHITDNAYQFFIILEQKRVELLNINRLHQENEEMVSKTITVLEKDAYVRRYWLDCFSCTSVENNLVS